MSLRVRKVGSVGRVAKIWMTAATFLTISANIPVLAVVGNTAAPEVPTLMKRGYEQLKKKDFRSAVTTFREAVKRNVNDPLARRCLAYALLSGGDAEEALNQLILLTRLAPPGAADWCTFGEVYLIAGSYEQAEGAFQDALKLDENLFWAKCGIIRAKAMQRDFKSAYRLIAELIADTHDDKKRRYLYALRIAVRRLELTPVPEVPKMDRPDVTPEELKKNGEEPPGA